MLKWLFGKKKDQDFPSPEMPDYVKNVEKIASLPESDKGGDTEENLLWDTVRDTEAESKKMKWSVAPWAYERLAILYRKRKAYKAEVAIIERFIALPDYARSRNSTRGDKIIARYEKAKALLEKQLKTQAD